MANTEISNYVHLSTILIHPLLFCGKLQMTEHDRLQLIPRNCYICGRVLNWREFIQTSRRKKHEFSYEELREIWENDIFILKCCFCYNGRTRRSDALDALTHAISWFDRREYEQNPIIPD